MANSMRWHRIVVILVNVVVIGTMGIIFALQRNQGPGIRWWVWLMLYVPPTFAIVSAILPNRRWRIIGLWLSGLLMTIPAAFGIFGGWGLLYLIAIVFTLFAAWQENEGR